MERKDFLLKGFAALGVAAVAPLAVGCKKDTNTTNGNCTESPTETEGPFPTTRGDAIFFASAGYVRSDIRDGELGTTLTVNIVIKNTNNNCAVMPGCYVEIWHCNKDGLYSEFGPSNSGGMQTVDATAYDYLRGKQQTDADGQVSFTTVYPGWYNGRAPHIHVHIYNSSGVSKLITQIAFTELVSNTVYTTATTYYNKGTQGTSNSSDGVFSDSLSQNICDSLTGSVAAGYVLTKTIYAAF
ncbi:MAG: intradiol ring-cleavage dioxygenase [Chitinophagales bacterium]